MHFSMIYQKYNSHFSFDSMYNLEIIIFNLWIGVSKQLSIFNQAYMHIAKNK